MNLNRTGVFKNNMFSNLPAGEDEGQISWFSLPSFNRPFKLLEHSATSMEGFF